MSTEKTFNDGKWTTARMDAFIKGLIREGLKRWEPKHNCIKNARIRRGWYRCEECKQEVPATIKRELKTKPNVFKRTKNIIADHVEPIIDPAVGRRTWDEAIYRAFVDTGGYQALCYACHSEKTAAERDIQTRRKRKEKEYANNS